VRGDVLGDIGSLKVFKKIKTGGVGDD